MSHQALLSTLRLSALVLVAPLAGCGGYSDPGDSTGGTSSTAGTSATAGSGGVGTAGTAGTAGAGTGGSAAGSGGSAAGAGGTGGSGGGTPDPPPASCEDATACGGMNVGVWFASSSCLPITGMADLSEMGLGCMMAPAKGKLSVTGNWTIEADGKIVDTTMTTGDVVLDLPPSCLEVSGTVTQCPNISAPLSAAGFSELDCVDAPMGGGCTCTGKVKQNGGMGYASFDPTANGTYTVAENTLTIKGVEEVKYPFCVEGSFMKVVPKGPKEFGVMNGTVMFVKQQ